MGLFNTKFSSLLKDKKPNKISESWLDKKIMCISFNKADYKYRFEIKF